MSRYETTIKACKAAQADAAVRYNAAITEIRQLLASPQMSAHAKAALLAQLQALETDMRNGVPLLDTKQGNGVIPRHDEKRSGA